MISHQSPTGNPSWSQPKTNRLGSRCNQLNGADKGKRINNAQKDDSPKTGWLNRGQHESQRPGKRFRQDHKISHRRASVSDQRKQFRITEGFIRRICNDIGMQPIWQRFQQRIEQQARTIHSGKQKQIQDPSLTKRKISHAAVAERWNWESDTFQCHHLQSLVKERISP